MNKKIFTAGELIVPIGLFIFSILMGLCLFCYIRTGKSKIIEESVSVNQEEQKVKIEKISEELPEIETVSPGIPPEESLIVETSEIQVFDKILPPKNDILIEKELKPEVQEDLSEQKDLPILEETSKTNTFVSEKENNTVTLQKIPQTETRNLRFLTDFGLSSLFFSHDSFIVTLFNQPISKTVPFIRLYNDFQNQQKFKSGISIQASLCQFSTLEMDYFPEKNLYIDTMFYATQIDFYIRKEILSIKNQLELHGGIGLSGLLNCHYELGDLHHKTKVPLYLSLGGGISYKHFFTNRFYAGIQADVNYVVPISDSFLFVQPALVGGFAL